jgi:molecular chaperone HscB
VAAEEMALLAQVAVLLDEQKDAPGAAAQVRALMFVKRFREDIAKRLDALDA